MTTDDLYPREITIPRPHIPHGPQDIHPNQADAHHLRKAAENLRDHYRPFGSNLRATIVSILQSAADAIENPEPHITSNTPPEVVTAANTTLKVKRVEGDYRVFASNPDAPEDMREMEVGRIIDGGFQVSPLFGFSGAGFTPEALKALLLLIELISKQEN